MTEPALAVRGLTVRFTTKNGLLPAVTDLDLTVEPGRTLAIVGESGSGKTAAATALLGLHDLTRTHVAGSIRLAGRELAGAPPAVWQAVRSATIAMVFQDPLGALHPLRRVGDQIAEVHRAHTTAPPRVARQRAVEMLDRVGIADPARRARQYPHELSGGMRQRAVIALALVNDPQVLVADEPTTALDVTVQAQVLDLLADIQSERGTAIVLVTHDLGVVAEAADDVLVLYAGRCVETGPVRDVLRAPLNPYTTGLLRSMPGTTPGELPTIGGAPPTLHRLPTGCPFHPRCPDVARVGPRCVTDLPDLHLARPGRLSRCHLSESPR